MELEVTWRHVDYYSSFYLSSVYGFGVFTIWNDIGLWWSSHGRLPHFSPFSPPDVARLPLVAVPSHLAGKTRRTIVSVLPFAFRFLPPVSTRPLPEKGFLWWHERNQDERTTIIKRQTHIRV